MKELTSVIKHRLVVICGHFGTGKTNISVNLAAASAVSGNKTVIVDLDIVNPYFRTADNAEALRKINVRPLIPEFANTNVDIPSLPPALPLIFEGNEITVVDIGGNEEGAVVLGGFSDKFEQCGYDMYYVYNYFRPENHTLELAVHSARAIENSSKMRFSGIINNTNLGSDTDAAVIDIGIKEATKFSKAIGTQLVLNTAFKNYDNPSVTVIDDITKKYF